MDELSRRSAMHAAGLGTTNKNLQRNPDDSLTRYAGAKSPGPDKESNWLPAPDGHFSLYIRAYWGQQPILDGSWRPPAVQVTLTGQAGGTGFRTLTVECCARPRYSRAEIPQID